MVQYVVEAVRAAGAERIVVVTGYGHEAVADVVSELGGEVVRQEQQLGTAHALLQAEQMLADFNGDILVVCGDTPLLRADTLSQLVADHRSSGAAATVLTAVLEDPYGYGRIIRDAGGRIVRIVEETDGAPEELAVQEVNTGVFCFKTEGLFSALKEISPGNRQGEYYLTDIITIYLNKGQKVGSTRIADPSEVHGVNTRRHLAEAEKLVRKQILNFWLDEGVTIIDPDSTYIAAAAQLGPDTVIHPFTIIEGDTVVGAECILGPGSRLVRCRIGRRVEVSYSVILESSIGDYSRVGPFAFIRPGCKIGTGVRIGDFVELKQTVVGTGSKVPHLSYVGDAVIGEGVNIGAGTITCNYDGEKKSTTVVEDGAFIGSNVNLVAPITVGRGAYIAAGSTIRRDVSPGALGVARSKQKNIPDWVRIKRRKKDTK